MPKRVNLESNLKITMIYKGHVQVGFEFKPFKLVFDELLLRKTGALFNIKVSSKAEKKETSNEDLMNSSRWIAINFFDRYFIGETWQSKHIEVCNFIFDFFKHLFEKVKFIEQRTDLLKIIFHSKSGVKLCFLFNEVYSLKSLKERFIGVISKIIEYRNGNSGIVEEIKSSFKLKRKEVFFIQKNKSWALVNLLANAGKHHHDHIAKNIADKRISKPDIYINEEQLYEKISYKALWELKTGKVKYIRVKPNDIALYSNISMTNLAKAQAIYDDINSVTYKNTQMIQREEDEKKFIEYCEFIITSVIVAYSSVEALINIAIPKDYFHKRKEKSNKTGKLSLKKNLKSDIERWYSMEDKMNIILPDALGIPAANQQKWWVRFDKLEKIRNKIVHVEDSTSNERYAEFIKKEIFSIVKSHMEVIKFFAKWATDSNHILLNDLPYGFGYDNIMPVLISSKTYNKADRERKGIE